MLFPIDKLSFYPCFVSLIWKKPFGTRRWSGLPQRKGIINSMHISADNYEIRFDPDQPNILHIFDTRTQSLTQLTLEEAVMMLKLMLKHREDIRLLKTGE